MITDIAEKRQSVDLLFLLLFLDNFISVVKSIFYNKEMVTNYLSLHK